MAGLPLSRFVGDDLLPPLSGGTARHQELSTILADPISDLVLDAEAFSQRALLMLDPAGTCTGLAWQGKPDSGIPLLCQFLDSVCRFSIYRDASLVPLAPVMRTVLSSWAKVFRDLSAQPDWMLLEEAPTTSNPFLHFQLRIAGTSAYPLVAAPLHRGICAKAHSLKDRPGASHHARLAEYAGWTVHIVEEIPSERIKDSLADYAPGEWDTIVQETISGLKKVKTLPGDSKEYSESSRSTLASDWQSVFFALSGNREFSRSAYSIRRFLADTAGEPEILLSDKRQAQSVLKIIHDAQSKQYCDEFGEEMIKPARSGNNRKKGYRLVGGGSACLAANPSAAMPGVLPRVVLAHLFGDRDGKETTSQQIKNRHAETAFLMLLLHLGRPLDWLLSLHVGEAPGSCLQCPSPLYDRKTNSIYFVPDRYISLPDDFHIDDKKMARLSSFKILHDQSYEQIDLLQQIILPPRLAGLLETFLDARRELVKGSPLEAVSLGCGENNGPLWLTLRQGRLSVWNDESVLELLQSQTDRVHRMIHHFPTLRPAHFTRSFQGYYADLGLRSEYRHYLSGRINYSCEVPLHYSRMSSQQVFQVHSQACEKWFKAILKLQKTLGIRSHLNSLKSEQVQVDGIIPAWTGSWRVIRQDVLAKLLACLKGCRDHAVDWDGGLPPYLVRYNALVRWLVVSMALLTGIRPLELSRVKPRHLDRETGWMAVHGKPHLTVPGYRRLPVLPELWPFLDQLLIVAKKEKHPYLFGLYNHTSMWKPLDSGSLDVILTTACQRLFMNAAPDFYSLRHRFRSDMLELRLDEYYLNYLMGHEAAGRETFNGYQERDFSGLTPSYENAARVLVARYGVL
jgi:hypothetical protein